MKQCLKGKERMWCRDGKVVGGADFRGEFKEVNCKERMSFWR